MAWRGDPYKLLLELVELESQALSVIWRWVCRVLKLEPFFECLLLSTLTQADRRVIFDVEPCLVQVKRLLGGNVEGSRIASR